MESKKFIWSNHQIIIANMATPKICLLCRKLIISVYVKSLRNINRIFIYLIDFQYVGPESVCFFSPSMK